LRRALSDWRSYWRLRMDKLIMLCFVLCFLMAVIGGIVFSDFGLSIFGMMFWCIGWVIAWGRTRHGS
jgi:hypothetical protein